MIADHPELASFVGPRTEGVISLAEHALEFRFPASYRRFVAALGAGSFGSFEIYGVVDGNFERSSVPNGVWVALEMRRLGDLPANLLPLCDLGYGGYYCIERRDAGYPVVVVEIGFQPGPGGYEVEAPDFGEFLVKGVRRQLLNSSN